ncbi:MarR family winged helix-turn-helix transcriptional regulator [Paracoccus albus]|uniref:MarR family winged helix-turn-helix transcriptional regulator n=1 Tax=Paracoccus albus TaxID=3017784 RepID=UPI0022F07C39|nr:MarR family winged helix-turn-helix transcriptional regulator [Paracoccus albus]WBU62126.1 MarR family winged helix-turn-helix transcriptional regulator [Paracoccus albus]
MREAISKTPARQAEPQQDIRDLLSFRLTRLSQVSDSVGQRWLSRDYGLRLLEWRVIGLAAAMSPKARFADVSRILNADKGQLSRTVSALVTKGLISQSPDPSDQRGRVLSLTGAGQDIYRRVMPEAVRRNAEMVRNLTSNEIAHLFELLEKMQPIMDERAKNEP